MSLRNVLFALGFLAVSTSLSVPAPAAAHDDPIVTVRILCNGFNVLDMDAVLGEISDSASISVDRAVQGRPEIEAWVREQMDHDLRIEIVDIGIPEKLPDGYTLSWTARFSRQDWRKAGMTAREAKNTVVIHNGRITQWSGLLATGSAVDAGAPVANPLPSAGVQNSGVPELFGIPLTLLVALGGVLAFVSFAVYRRAH
jgi:hypothetical protein